MQVLYAVHLCIETGEQCVLLRKLFMKYVCKNGSMVLEIGGSALLIRQTTATQQPLRNLIGRQERYRTIKGFLFLQKGKVKHHTETELCT